MAVYFLDFMRTVFFFGSERRIYLNTKERNWAGYFNQCIGPYIAILKDLSVPRLLAKLRKNQL